MASRMWASCLAPAQGFVAIEVFVPGGQVVTLGIGLQFLRQGGHRTVPSQGNNAAVSIPAGTSGDHGGPRVSPQHQVAISGNPTEVESGVAAALVKALHRVQAGLLRQDLCGSPATDLHP